MGAKISGIWGMKGTWIEYGREIIISPGERL
jgi:hypothetical protein